MSVRKSGKFTQWREKYENFLIQNASQVSSIESSIQTLQYILPGQFKDVEIASESLYSVLNILGLYHDSILFRAVDKIPNSPLKPKFSVHNTYTRSLLARNKLYKSLALLLTITRYSEILFEMIIKKKNLSNENSNDLILKFKNEKNRYKFILYLEIYKAVVRFLLFWLSGFRPLTSPIMPEREITPETLNMINSNESQTHNKNKDNTNNYNENLIEREYLCPRTGKIIPPLPTKDINGYLMTNVLSFEDVCQPEDLLQPVNNLGIKNLLQVYKTNNSSKGLIAEVIYILRPLIYCTFLYKYRNNKNDWRPWLVGLSMELISRNLYLQHYEDTRLDGLRGLTELEKDELTKRKKSLWWWALRGSFYENFSGPFIHGFANKTKKIPGLNIFGTIVDDFAYMLDNYYYSSATL